MTITPTAPNTALRLVPIQTLRQGGRWRTEAMRSYRMPMLLWITRGQGRATIGGVTHGYGAYNAVFVPSRVMHGFDTGPQVFGTAVFFGKDIEVPLPNSPCHLRVRDVQGQTEVASLLDQIQREIANAQPQYETALAHLAALLAIWLRRQISSQPGTRSEASAAQRLAERFSARIEDQLYTGQGVSEHAEALGVTPTHLSRVCRETCGRPASDLLADRVTFEARRLLLDTSMPVKRVAELLGYRSAAYFTRAFQKRTGQTPSAFRERHTA